MEKEPHVQGVICDVDHIDYRISLNKETLENVRNGDIIRSKIVYLSEKDCAKFTQKQLLITLLGEEERNKIFNDTRIIHTPEKIGLKISSRLLDTLIEENLEDYEYRYDVAGNKVHFLIKNSKTPFNDKSEFDDIFKRCEKKNKKEPTSGDLFESEYINVYNKPQDT